MTENVRLSRREIEVLQLLLEGKGNKQIAGSLDISIRTVEFHLKNIYAKFQVTSRIELILKLGNATGKFEIKKLGYSTVDRPGKKAENRDWINPWTNWVSSFQDIVSTIGKESEMKNLLNSKHVLVGMITALSTGVLWVLTMLYSQTIPPYEIKGWTVPLIIIWAIIGLSVGLVGKHNGIILRRVFFGALFGTGLSPFLIIPLMFIIVLPLGKLAEWLGLIDPATMPSNVATMLTAITMGAILLIVGLIIGITSLFVTIRKPGEKDFHGQISEHTM
jgi:DNA-binding CsgD family transcriptional regulator